MSSSFNSKWVSLKTHTCQFALEPCLVWESWRWDLCVGIQPFPGSRNEEGREQMCTPHLPSWRLLCFSFSLPSRCPKAYGANPLTDVLTYVEIMCWADMLLIFSGLEESFFFLKSLRPRSLFVPSLILLCSLAHVCIPQPAGPNAAHSTPKSHLWTFFLTVGAHTCHVVLQERRPEEEGPTWHG